MLTRRALLPVLIAAAVPARAAAPVRVVATFSILADLVRQVGGEGVEVTALVGPDQDLHGFEPRPSDLRAVQGCEVMVSNGLGLEGWAERLAGAARFKGVSVVATRGVKALPLPGHAGAHGHGHGAADPHAWQDVANAKLYVANIRDGLARARPEAAAVFQEGAARQFAVLEALDAEIRALFAPVPRDRRRVVTTHDAFGYFARAYGVDMVAPVGAWADSEPSAREIAALTRQIRTQGITALFLETIGQGAALRVLARETGVRIGGQLYSDALSPPDGPAATYVEMMRFNARAIAAALR